MIRIAAAAAPLALAAVAAAQIAGFPTYAQIVADLSNAANASPALCQLVDLTATYSLPQTVGGHSLYAVKISDNVAAEEDEPSFLLVAAHHGNEYGTPIVALHAMNQLLAGYGSDPAITALVDEYEIWIAPCWNVDRYPTVRTNLNGVDLNRNYPFSWASSCNSGVRGPSPGSEIETQTMLAFAEDQRFTKVLDFHSSGREVVYGYAQGCSAHPFQSWFLAEATALSTAMGYGGQVRGPSADGEHYQHEIGVYGSYALLTEISNTQSPTRASADAEAAQIWPGIVGMLQRPIPVWGHVTDAVTGLPLAATITFPNVAFVRGETQCSEPGHGRYHAFLPPGAHLIRFELAGYQTVDVPVTVTAASLRIDVQLSPPGLAFVYPNGLPATVDPAGGTVIRVDVQAANAQPQSGTGRVVLQSANGSQVLPMVELAANSYEAVLPGFACADTVQVLFAADDTSSTSWQSQPLFLPTATVVTVTATEPFEVATGWTGGQPGDTATSGQWNRMDPEPTAAQPGDDHTPNGTQCWVTNGLAGTSIGANDVDGGFTTLLSPVLDLSAVPNAGVRYWRWFSNNQGSYRDDEFAVDAWDAPSASWVRVDTVAVSSSEAAGGWFEHSLRVGDFVTPGSQVRFRFVASDLGSGSIVEAAIDDFAIFTLDCDGEVARAGHGCPDSTGTLLRVQQTGSTHLGASFAIAVDSGSALPSFVVAGFGDVSWNGAPLPVAIPGSGPGCQISIAADFGLGLVPHGGAVTTAVPNVTNLAGLSIFWQAVMFDPALVTPAKLAASDHLRTTIGS